MGGETRSPRNLEPQYNEGAARSPAQSVTAHGIGVREDTKRQPGEGFLAASEGFVVPPATYPARPATYLARAATYPAASEGFVVPPATFASRRRLSRTDCDFLGPLATYLGQGSGGGSVARSHRWLISGEAAVGADAPGGGGEKNLYRQRGHIAVQGRAMRIHWPRAVWAR